MVTNASDLPQYWIQEELLVQQKSTHFANIYMMRDNTVGFPCTKRLYRVIREGYGMGYI
jgi:hypothetical protein